MSKISGVIILSVALVCIVSCSTQGGTPNIRTQTPTSAASHPSLTALPTATTQPTSTMTPIPPTIAPLPSLTATVTRTITPTLKATLTDAERDKMVRELLITNRGCRLPCWWGIHPGKTTWSEAEYFLRSIGVRILPEKQTEGYDLYLIGGIELNVVDRVAKINNSLVIYSKDGMVKYIGLRGDGSLDEIGFQKAWERYSPQNIMRIYGKPSRILLNGNPFSHSIEGYSVWFFYDEQGFVIEYRGLVQGKSVYHICPSFDNGKDIYRIDILTQSEEVPMPLDRIYLELYGKRFLVLPLEKASGKSVEAYYRETMLSDKPACFDVPNEIWQE